MNFRSLAVMACVMGSIVAAQADTPTDNGKQGCFWIGGPAMFEYKIPQQSFTISAGVAPVIVNDPNSIDGSTMKIGFAAEAFYYTTPDFSGLGLSIRGGNAGGSTYFGPGVYYVSRPKSGVAFRMGVMKPFGSGVTGVVPEIAFGFQF